MPEFVTEQNASVQAVKEIFDSAFFETSIDSDGDLVIKDGFRTIVFVQADRIRYLAGFRGSPSASQAAKVEYANRMNNEYVMVRTTCTPQGGLRFDYYIMLAGGVPKPYVIHSFRRFVTIVKSALGDDTSNVIA